MKKKWWHDKVAYQIYPKSFLDTNGDGIGDLGGIISKLDYLKELGIDIIWLSPIYKSPFVDQGYDISDYYAIAEEFGTMEQFEELLAEAKKRDMYIIMDLVINHCSDQHEWFKKALADPDGEYADYFYFVKGKDGREPSNYRSYFGGNAWEPVPGSDKYYLHMFAKEQPDWNWKNEDVRADSIKTLRFWLDHGADGFRVDVAHGLAKDLDRDDLDDYVVWCTNDQPEDGSHPVIDRDEVHDIYHEWRKVFNEYDPPAFAVAEAWVRPSRQHLYASPDDLGQIFNFEFAKKDWIRDDMHLAIEEGLESAERSGSTATWVMSNHDVVRHATRYALPQVPTGEYHRLPLDWLLRDGTTYREDRALGTKRARAAIMMEMALPGSAYVYQGEELGLFEVADIPWDELEDPSAWRTSRSASTKGRDGCRVPLPWVAADAPQLDDPNDEFGHGGSFGFSPADAKAEPHLPQPKWYKDFAVDVESADPDSMLNLYRRVLALRHELQTTDLSLEWLPEDQPGKAHDGANGFPGGTIAYRRANGWASITNFGEEPITLPQGEVLLTSGPLTDDGKLPQDTSAWLKLAD